MPTITQNVADIAGVPDNTAWIFFTEKIRRSADGTKIITTDRVRVPPVNGVLTISLDPGPAVALSGDTQYPFIVPSTDSELWPLIQASVGVPPTTTQQQLDAAVAAYIAAHPPSGGAWGSITGTLSAQTDLQSALAAKAPLASPTFTGTVSGVTKTHVGLANVTNNAQYFPGGTDVAIADGGTGVSTLPTGLLKGAGTSAITAATAADYVPPGSSPYDLSYPWGFGVRAVGLGDNVIGVKLQRAVTFTSVTFRCAVANASGNLVAEIRKNGTVVSGTSTTIAAASQVAGGTSTGSWAFSAGDILTIAITAIGTPTTPSSSVGLVADIKGTG